MNSDQIASPLTGGSTSLVKEINVAWLKHQFSQQLNIDISRFFCEDKVELRRCNYSGYEFYYPLDLAGDSAFYAALQQFDWYYMESKWEHRMVLNRLQGHEKVVEVGSGNGGFLRSLRDKEIEAIGLELNAEMGQTLIDSGLNVVIDSIENFVSEKENTFDWSCSFEVLEHISDVKSFIKSQIHLLKPGGYLSFAVPNNDAFIKYEDGGILNFPPHHMGRWGYNSIKSLERLFPMRLEKVLYEPLQQYHFHWFIRIATNRFPRLFGNRICRSLLTRVLPFYAKFIKGHTILAVFKKL